MSRDWLRRAVDAVCNPGDGTVVRQYRVLVVVGVLVAATGVGAAGVAVMLADPVSQSETITYEAGDGPAVSVTGSTTVSGTQLFPGDGSVQYLSAAGNLTVSGSPDASLAVTTSNITGDWTTVSSISASGGVTILPEDKQQITVDGSASRLSFRDASVDDSTPDLVLDSGASATTVQVQGLPETTGVGAVSANGSLLDSNQTTENGVATFTLRTDGDTEIRLQTGQGSPRISNLNPSGELSVAPGHVSANITDLDFPADEVTVTFEVDGETVGEDTVSGPGEVSTSLDGVSSGQHDLSVTAEDEYGLTSTATTTFAVPTGLNVWNASNPSELVNETEITVFAGEQVFNRTTSDGTLDLTGLPAGQRLTVQVSSDEYRTRTVTIESLATQQDVFLIPENETVVETDFLLEDNTGNFEPESTVIQLSAPITQNGTTRYRQVAADTPGQSGFIVDLREGVRYRISVQNEDGAVRDLDTYTPQVPRTVELTVGDVQFGEDTGSQGVVASANLNTSTSSPSVSFRFRDVGGQTDELEYRVIDSDGGVVQANQTVSSPESAYDRIPVPSEDGEYRVEWTAQQGSESVSGVERVGSVPALFGGGVLDSAILELLGWILIAAFGGLLVITNSRIEGIGTVVITAILVILGVVQAIPMVAVSLAGTAAVLLYLGR